MERVVKISLTKKEDEVIRELAKRDEVSIEKELYILLLLQILKEVELHEDEEAWQ